MKILIVSQYFWPENFRINDLAVDLYKRGYDVSVLTGKPNYPQGKFYKGYSFLGFNKEYYNGVKIYRVPLIPRGNGTGLTLALNYISFVIFSCIFILFHTKKYDLTFTYAVSPITQVFPALLHKRLFSSKSFLWLQDLWPESVSAAGKVKSNILISLLNKMVKYIYKDTDKILVQSEAFISSVEEKGVNRLTKIRYVPYWAEDLFCNTINSNRDKFKSIMPDGFKVMFAGNIGEAQDFDSIINAVILTQEIPEIKWIFVGDGRKKAFLEKEIIRLNLKENIFLLGRFPLEEMPNFFIHADIMLVTLKKDNNFSKTIPSRIQSYMAFGKPIVGMLNGIGAQVLKEANCGYVCNSSDYVSLANNVMNAYRQKKEILKQKGINGKQFYDKNFSKVIIIDRLLKIFQEN